MLAVSLSSRSLILSQLDAGLKDEASRTCNKAIQLASKNVPHKLLDLVRLQVGVVIISVSCDVFLHHRLAIIWGISRPLIGT